MAAARHLNLGENDLIGFTRNALEAAFVDEKNPGRIDWSKLRKRL